VKPDRRLGHKLLRSWRRRLLRQRHRRHSVPQQLDRGYLARGSFRRLVSRLASDWRLQHQLLHRRNRGLLRQQYVRYWVPQQFDRRYLVRSDQRRQLCRLAPDRWLQYKLYRALDGGAARVDVDEARLMSAPTDKRRGASCMNDSEEGGDFGERALQLEGMPAISGPWFCPPYRVATWRRFDVHINRSG
jgi:hypothetical protein